MLASTAAIKAAEAYVALSLRDDRLKGGLSRAKSMVKSSMATMTGYVSGLAGAYLSLQKAQQLFTAGVQVQQALADLRSVANPTAEAMERITKAVMAMSGELGRSPVAVTDAFTELLRAGVSLEVVLGGAAKAVVQFARVGKIETAEAAVVVADAMNVFRVSAEEATNAIGAAAEASSTDIRALALAFSMSSAVARQAGLGIRDLAGVLAVLANNGLKGSDAGTAVKTMLLRLMAPVDQAAATINEIGLVTRDATGEMLPLRDIIDNLRKSLSQFDRESQDRAMNKIFGTDAIRVAAILAREGKEGIDAMAASMSGATTIAEKYAAVTSTLNEEWVRLSATFERVGGLIVLAFQEPIKEVIDWLKRAMLAFETFFEMVYDMVQRMKHGMLPGGGADEFLTRLYRKVARSRPDELTTAIAPDIKPAVSIPVGQRKLSAEVAAEAARSLTTVVTGTGNFNPFAGAFNPITEGMRKAGRQRDEMNNWLDKINANLVNMSNKIKGITVF